MPIKPSLQSIGVSRITAQRLFNTRSLIRPNNNIINAIRTYSNPTGNESKANEKILIEVFRRDDCMLCEEAKEEILSTQLKSKIPMEFREIDIFSDEAKNVILKYQFHIPVIHINGKFWGKHKVNPELLLETLEQISGKK